MRQQNAEEKKWRRAWKALNYIEIYFQPKLFASHFTTQRKKHVSTASHTTTRTNSTRNEAFGWKMTADAVERINGSLLSYTWHFQNWIIKKKRKARRRYWSGVFRIEECLWHSERFVCIQQQFNREKRKKIFAGSHVETLCDFTFCSCIRHTSLVVARLKFSLTMRSSRLNEWREGSWWKFLQILSTQFINSKLFSRCSFGGCKIILRCAINFSQWLMLVREWLRGMMTWFLTLIWNKNILSTLELNPNVYARPNNAAIKISLNFIWKLSSTACEGCYVWVTARETIK